MWIRFRWSEGRENNVERQGGLGAVAGSVCSVFPDRKSQVAFFEDEGGRVRQGWKRFLPENPSRKKCAQIIFQTKSRNDCEVFCEATCGPRGVGVEENSVIAPRNHGRSETPYSRWPFSRMIVGDIISVPTERMAIQARDAAWKFCKKNPGKRFSVKRAGAIWCVVRVS